MRLIRGLPQQFTIPNGCVLTFGNFDSVHRGHQAIILRVVELAREQQLPSCVIIFEPQPEEFFRPDDCPARLTCFREKIMLLQALQVDYVAVLYFKYPLALYTAQQFVDDVLVKHFQVQQLVVGEDARFGMDQQGDVNFLMTASRKYGYQLEVHETLLIAADERSSWGASYRISSSLVRQVLREGYLKLAAQLLGRPYSLSGRVVRGNKLARKLDFPTANIYLHRKKSPVLGVYQVKVRGRNGLSKEGIANIGYRPTVRWLNRSSPMLVLEVHLFDFNQDIYGEHLQVELVRKVRDEHFFDTVSALKKQIELDIKQVKEWINHSVLT